MPHLTLRRAKRAAGGMVGIPLAGILLGLLLAGILLGLLLAGIPQRFWPIWYNENRSETTTNAIIFATLTLSHYGYTQHQSEEVLTMGNLLLNSLAVRKQATGIQTKKYRAKCSLFARYLDQKYSVQTKRSYL